MAALVAVAGAVAAFVLWSSETTNTAVQQATSAVDRSTAYDATVTALAAQQSLARDFQLNPTPGSRAAYDQAAQTFQTALDALDRISGGSLQRAIDQVRHENQAYQTAVTRLFDAAERSPDLIVDRDADIDLWFDRLNSVMTTAAQAQHRRADQALAHLRALEQRERHLTPVVILLGFVLAGVLSWISRGHRRQLDAERAGAVYRSQHDHISGLPNRTVLTARMADALARENGLITVLLIDLNHFKDVNTTLGHLEGDQILARVGARLRAAVREEDVVAHLGGDEFVVLLTDVTADEAGLEVAARLHAVLDEGFAVGEVEIDVEATMALATSGRPGDDPDTLLRNAYIAMETAKAQGHPVLVHEQAADEKSSHKLVLLSDLRRGISRGELVLHYQPKIDIGSGALVGAEALVRWNHPELGFVPPDRFIPIAEQTGLIHPLTRYVLDAALMQARTWQQAGTPVRVAVNLSARNLLNDELPGQIADLLAGNGVSAALLELEVTESAIMTDPQRALHVLNDLAGMGIGLSIDDFGTGYTSIGQLRHLPVHELKIDRSFVTALATDATDAMIVRSIVELGHNLGLSIVAEGVEDDATRCVLAGVGCDIAQGFGISRPLPADRFDAWMRSYVPTSSASLPVR
ncbi:hypothetical protein Kisp02_43730 [Kineosporia sp. NBRC 101731]|nr:hypothetical protein Kisp02_43730 [Kineosporia sp. NBRC 101731]